MNQVKATLIDLPYIRPVYVLVGSFSPNGVLPRVQAGVENCVHFVYPINARRTHVFDPKIETLAYDQQERILEIAFKSGQVWQLAGVSPNIFAELSDSTISSFLKFIARRYKASPVKQGMAAVGLPEAERCPAVRRR